jgi:hypothetical protein
MATTTLEVTLRIAVNHPNQALDENSVKALINEGTSAIADNVGILTTIGDEPAESVCVSVTKLRLQGTDKRFHQLSLSLYGTDAVPWGRD